MHGVLDELGVDEFAVGVAVVEVVDFDEFGAVAGELLVADGVDLELLGGDVFALGAVAGFEVDDDVVAGVGAADEVNTAVDDDAVAEFEFDVLFDMFEFVEGVAVTVQVASEGFVGGAADVFEDEGVGVG